MAYEQSNMGFTRARESCMMPLHDMRFFLFSLFLLIVRGDAKMGFKFKISLKVNVRLPVYPETPPERFMKTSADKKNYKKAVKVGSSL